MFVFWRPEALSDVEAKLFSLISDAHTQSVFRDNVSSHVIQAAMLGSGDYSKAIAAGLMTLGGSHAPIEQTIDLFSHKPAETAREMLREGKKVPGWGSSFTSEEDPIWTPVRDHIAQHWPQHIQMLESVTTVLHMAGKKIYPNPSSYTALTAIILGLPKKVAAYLLINGRLAAWTHLVNLSSRN